MNKLGLTFEFHAHFKALLETAKGASFPLGFVDVTLALSYTRVHFLVLDGPFEKAFARLAGEKAVMVAGHFVSADRTKLLDAFLGVRDFRERVLNDGLLEVDRPGLDFHAGLDA